MLHPLPVRPRKTFQSRATQRAAAAPQPADARRRGRGNSPRGFHRPPEQRLRRPARDGHGSQRERPVRQLARLAARFEPPRPARSGRSRGPRHELHHPPPLREHPSQLFLLRHARRGAYRPHGRTLLPAAERGAGRRPRISLVHAGRHAADERRGIFRHPAPGSEHHAAQRVRPARRTGRADRRTHGFPPRRTGRDFAAHHPPLRAAASTPSPCTRSRRRYASKNN